MEIDTVLMTAVISATASVIVTLGPKLLSRRGDNAKANNEDAQSAKTLSETARIQIDTYNDEVVTPLKERLNGLETENKALKQLLIDSNTAINTLRAENALRIDQLRSSHGEQVDALQLQIRNLIRSQDAQREQIVILIEQSESKDHTIRQMQQEIEQLHRENEDLRQRVGELQAENISLKTKPTGE